MRILAIMLILIPICFSQSRQNVQRKPPARPRPFFQQQAVLFEEAPHGTKIVLKNGLTILVEEFKSKSLVSIQTHIRVGALDESDSQHGAAQLIPSLVCRRPANKNSGTLEQNVYVLGGLLRNSVNFENTQFEIVAPSGQWKKALTLQAEALKNPSFNQEDVAAEVSLLVKSALDTLDDPYESSMESILELAFDDTRLVKYREIAETRWKGVKPEDLSKFFKTYYVPSRITVVISGDVSATEALNEAARTFGEFSSSSKSVPTASIGPINAGFRYRLLRGDTAIPRVIFGFRLKDSGVSDFRALEVLSAMLGLGEGSVLKYRLRDQDHLIASGETTLWGDQNIACLLIWMEMDPDNIDRSQIAALTEIELLKRREPEEADLVRAVTQLETAYWKRLEEVSGRGETSAHFNSLGDWKGRGRYLSDLKKVKPSDIKRVATKYLRLEAASLLEYLPLQGDDARNPTTEGIRQTLEGLLGPSADEQQDKRSKEIVPYLKIPKSVVSFKSSEVQYPLQVASILRGPEMYIREDHTSPLITMGVYFAGGRFNENANNAGITRLMTTLLASGSREMRDHRLYHQLEVYGAQIEPVVRDDYFGFNFSILSDNFEEGFNLFKQIIKTQSFEKEDVERQKRLQGLEIRRRKFLEAHAWDLLKQVLFKDSAYAASCLGTEESLKGITAASLVEWHADQVRNRKPIVVIIGDTKGTSLASHFVKEFSGSRMRDARIPETWVKPVNKGELIEQRWRKRQSLILIGFQGPPMNDEDSYSVRVLENFAGNLGHLAQTIRFKMGTAHRISMIYEPRVRGGSLIAYATADPENEEVVFNGIQSELLKIASGPNTYRDCRSAINAAVGIHEIFTQRRLDQIREIAENLLAGKGIDTIQGYSSMLLDINAEELTTLAQRIFSMEKAVVVKMHGLSNREGMQ